MLQEKVQDKGYDGARQVQDKVQDKEAQQKIQRCKTKAQEIKMQEIWIDIGFKGARQRYEACGQA